MSFVNITLLAAFVGFWPTVLLGDIAPNDDVPSHHPNTSPDQAVYVGISPDVIPLHKTFLSPDGRFTVQITPRSQYERAFTIQEKTQKSVSLPSWGIPIISLEWAPDSCSLVAVEHFAHTSVMDIHHWNGQKWQSFHIYAPENPKFAENQDNCHVINWSYSKDRIHAVFIADATKTYRHIPVGFWKSSFDIYLPTGDIDHVKNTEISEAQYRAFRTNFN